MKRREWKIKNNHAINLVGALLVLCLLAYNCGASIGFSSLDEPVAVGSPPDSTGEYGKFIIYKVGDGKIKGLSKKFEAHDPFYYRVTDFQYKPFPTYNPNTLKRYNMDFCGDGYSDSSPSVPVQGQSLFYKDSPMLCNRQMRNSSDHPEAITLNNQLFLYYTNYPIQTNVGQDYLSCKCMSDCPASAGTIVDGYNPGTDPPNFYDFPDTPDANVPSSVLKGFNCGAIIALSTPANRKAAIGVDTPDTDWLSLPVSSMGFGQYIPLKIRLMGDQLNMIGLRIIKMDLYETAPGVKPDLTADIPVASNRFGFDYYRSRDPILGYVVKPDRDYWLKVSDWSTIAGSKPSSDYKTLIYFEATPVLPIYWDPTSAVYKAELKPARSGNWDLANGPFYEPDDMTTKIQDLFPDCDGIAGSGDEGDWGIYEICPVEGTANVEKNDELGFRDGALEYQEVDNKENIDDGEHFAGKPTNLASMGNEAPSVIQVGGSLWMFISTGSGIFQLTSKDGLAGMEWDMSNITKNLPSLLPRSMDPMVPGDANAPVVSSGKYGMCETEAKGDDIQVIAKGKGFANASCITFGENAVMDSYPMEDQLSSDIINSGADGVINTWNLPSCAHYSPPVYGASNYQRKTGAYGNPDLFCGDSVTGANDHTAFLLGDDQWDTNAIGLNPPEYWRRQNCNIFTMAEEFSRCALGKSNVTLAVSGNDDVLNTAAERLAWDDYFCHNGTVVGICPGANGIFDQSGVKDIVNLLRSVPQGDDYLCEINPAVGLEYARFKFANTQKLKFATILPDTEKVVSLTLQKAGLPAVLSSASGDYRMNYTTGEMTIGSNNWLAPVAGGDRTKDVLIVFYRYQGSQIGVCPGMNGSIETPYYFYANYTVPDRIFGGPPIEYPASLGGGLVNTIGLGDVLVGAASGSDVFWDPVSERFVCNASDCPIAPGSDNTLDSAWFLDADITGYSKANNYTVKPNRFDLYGQADDWLCPVDGQWALCPGGNDYFQIYRLYGKVEMKRYEGVDDVLENFENPNNPCYELEIIQERSHFYKNDESVYVLNAYQGIIGDDRVAWDPVSLTYYITTGTNGINQSCISQNDYQLIPRFTGQPYQAIIDRGPNGSFETKALKDKLVFIEIQGEKPLPKIIAGDDGICNSFRVFDDNVEVFFGTGAPDYPCVLAGPNGFANTPAQGNDAQLYLPGEKTGFDSFAVDTPEVVADGNKLYLFYSGVGWMGIPHSVPPGRGALAKLGECKRPGIDNRWGNTSYTYKLIDHIEERGFIADKDGKTNGTFMNALDDNQGVILAPRIGVATSTIERVAANPSDWSRVLTPAVDVGGICSGTLGAALSNFSIGDLSISGGIALPPIFNYLGGFSPEVIIKYNNDPNKQPIFMMWLTGIFALRDDGGYGGDPDNYNIGLYKPLYQIGLARSIDGINFDLANDINPLVVTGDIVADFGSLLGGGGDKPQYQNATVFPGAEEESYGMIFKMSYTADVGQAANPIITAKTSREWLAFGARNGFLYGGGLAGLISCKINSGHLQTGQGIYKWGTYMILILPVVVVLIVRMKTRKRDKS